MKYRIEWEADDGRTGQTSFNTNAKKPSLLVERAWEHVQTESLFWTGETLFCHGYKYIEVTPAR